MRWLEEIRLITNPQRENEAIEILLETAESVNRDNKQKPACVYSHYAAAGGFSLILDWETSSIPLRGSDTAMLIVEGLKPLGLLDHTILVERGKSEKFKEHRVRRYTKNAEQKKAGVDKKKFS